MILFDGHFHKHIGICIKNTLKLCQLALYQFFKIVSEIHFSSNDRDVHTTTRFFRRKHKRTCFPSPAEQTHPF